MRIELDFAAEDPVDADRVGNHDRHSQNRDDEHDSMSGRGRSGVVYGQAVFDDRTGDNEVGVNSEAERREKSRHGTTG